MRLEAITLDLLTEKKDTTGTYVAMKFSEASMDALMKIASKTPDPLPRKELHVTLIFSRKGFEFKAEGKLDPVMKVKPKKFDFFETDEGARCLVLMLDAPDAVERHEFIMDKHKATYDHDKYQPHVSLCYDVGKDFTLDSLDISSLPDELEMVEEYTTPLNLNWAAEVSTAKD